MDFEQVTETAGSVRGLQRQTYSVRHLLCWSFIDAKYYFIIPHRINEDKTQFCLVERVNHKSH